MQLCRAFRTRFRFGSDSESLNLAAYDNSPAHYAKGTRSHITAQGLSFLTPPGFLPGPRQARAPVDPPVK